MHGNLNDLDGGVVARLDGGVAGQRHLGQADGARVGVLGWAQDLEGADHGVAHVLGPAAGAVGAEAQVHVDEGRGVALEPAGLEGDGAAGRGPVGAVCRRGVATACGMSVLVFVRGVRRAWDMRGSVQGGGVRSHERREERQGEGRMG